MKLNVTLDFCANMNGNILCRILSMDFSMSPPKNISNMFGNWLKGNDKKVKIQIQVGFAF